MKTPARQNLSGNSESPPHSSLTAYSCAAANNYLIISMPYDKISINMGYWKQLCDWLYQPLRTAGSMDTFIHFWTSIVRAPEAVLVLMQQGGAV